MKHDARAKLRPDASGASNERKASVFDSDNDSS
jgi:hypothetical protein